MCHDSSACFKMAGTYSHCSIRSDSEIEMSTESPKSIRFRRRREYLFSAIEKGNAMSPEFPAEKTPTRPTPPWLKWTLLALLFALSIAGFASSSLQLKKPANPFSTALNRRFKPSEGSFYSFSNFVGKTDSGRRTSRSDGHQYPLDPRFSPAGGPRSVRRLSAESRHRSVPGGQGPPGLFPRR